MLVYMRHCVANPKYILKGGKVYDAPKWLYDLLVSPKQGGVPVYTDDGGAGTKFEPAGVPYNEKLHGKRPILKIPARPDPEDVERDEIEEEFEELV